MTVFHVGKHEAIPRTIVNVVIEVAREKPADEIKVETPVTAGEYYHGDGDELSPVEAAGKKSPESKCLSSVVESPIGGSP